MSACEKFDKYEKELLKKFSKIEVNSLASFCIIADDFTEGKKEANAEWQWYCVADNEASLLRSVRDVFDTLA